MSKEALCLSAKINVFRQAGHVETKAQLSKDGLKERLQGIIDGTNDLGCDPLLRKYLLKNYLFGKKSVDKEFIQFLIAFLSYEDTPIPGPRDILQMDELYRVYRDHSIDAYQLLRILNQSRFLTSSNGQAWPVIKKFLSIPLHIACGNSYRIYTYSTAFIKNFNFAIANYPAVVDYLNDSRLLFNENVERIITHTSHEDVTYALTCFQTFINIDFESKCLKAFIVDEMLQRIHQFASQQADGSLKDLLKLNTFNMQVLDRYFVKYPDKLTFDTDVSDKIFSASFKPNIRLIEGLLDVSDGSEEIIRRATDCLMKSAMHFDIEKELFIEMFMCVYYHFDDMKRRTSTLDVEALFWTMKMYAHYREYSENDFEESFEYALAKQPNKAKELHKYVFEALFFRYESPWILIRNMNASVYGILEFLLQHHRIDHYPELPFHINKKDAKYFYFWSNYGEAPEIRTSILTNTLIYARLLKMGISKYMIKTIMNASRERVNLELWERNAAFFVKFQDAMGINEARDIVDFILRNPQITTKKRTLKSMRRLVHDWHVEIALRRVCKDTSKREWKKQPIDDFIYSEEYQIVQYSKAIQLIEEGANMQHCVASYVRDCASGFCSIWSLQKVMNDRKTKSLVTIELRNNNIIQAKGARNRNPDNLEWKIIEKWAKYYNLQLNKA